MESKQEKRREASEKNGEVHKLKEEEEEKEDGVPLMALNHVSRLCRSVKKSIEFYTKVLGFVVIERPPAFESFDGAWLFNYGIGIHLVESHDEERFSRDHNDIHVLDPMDNHISFQCEDMEAMERRLKEFNIKYMKRTVENEGKEDTIDQLFFNDPDGFMIEICNCENITLVPAGSLGKIKLPFDRHSPPVALPNDNHAGSRTSVVNSK